MVAVPAGTHEGSLFPGLSGIAGKIKYKYRLLEDELPPSKEEPNE